MSEIVCIKIFIDKLKAEICKDYLSKEGIVSYLNSDDCGGLEPQMAIHGVKLMVNEEDSKRALALISDLETN
ncbi:MAG: hypothetical protein K1060chlam4_00530 [Candidatus Anoxychlamydiales bacterium]|nr:hypothetical protein [Candidatus Anoxychlamydiales bacterium]NGX53227.1 hypothetical protein [Candidatus Anoxychlamydiales bacterium]